MSKASMISLMPECVIVCVHGVSAWDCVYVCCDCVCVCVYVCVVCVCACLLGRRLHMAG